MTCPPKSPGKVSAGRAGKPPLEGCIVGGARELAVGGTGGCGALKQTSPEKKTKHLFGMYKKAVIKK